MFQYLWFGLVTAAFLLIATLGFALTSRVNNFLNIAHAEYMSAGAIGAWALTDLLHLPFVVAAILAVIGVALLGLLFGRVVYEPMLRRGPEILLITSVGVVYLLHGVSEALVTPGTKNYPLPDLANWHVLGISINPYQLAVLVIAAASFVLLHVFLTRTDAGRSVRAIANNRELAEVRGIDVRAATRLVWLIASGLAGLAGVCLGMIGTLTTDLAFEQILLVLAVSILAGLGSVYGVAVAAVILGLSMDLSTMVIDPGYRTAVAFLLIILVLIFRPQGLFGRKVRVA